MLKICQNDWQGWYSFKILQHWRLCSPIILRFDSSIWCFWQKSSKKMYKNHRDTSLTHPSFGWLAKWQIRLLWSQQEKLQIFWYKLWYNSRVNSQPFVICSVYLTFGRPYYTNNLCRWQLPLWQCRNREKSFEKLHQRDQNCNEMVFEHRTTRLKSHVLLWISEHSQSSQLLDFCIFHDVTWLVAVYAKFGDSAVVDSNFLTHHGQKLWNFCSIVIFADKFPVPNASWQSSSSLLPNWYVSSSSGVSSLPNFDSHSWVFSVPKAHWQFSSLTHCVIGCWCWWCCWWL